jgi:hypothetical protein
MPLYGELNVKILRLPVQLLTHRCHEDVPFRLSVVCKSLFIFCRAVAILVVSLHLHIAAAAAVAAAAWWLLHSCRHHSLRRPTGQSISQSTSKQRYNEPRFRASRC